MFTKIGKSVLHHFKLTTMGLGYLLSFIMGSAGLYALYKEQYSSAIGALAFYCILWVGANDLKQKLADEQRMSKFKGE